MGEGTEFAPRHVVTLRQTPLLDLAEARRCSSPSMCRHMLV